MSKLGNHFVDATRRTAERLGMNDALHADVTALRADVTALRGEVAQLRALVGGRLPKASGKKRYRPTANTRQVIDLIQQGYDNNQICRALPGTSVASIRTVRCRYDNDLYEL